MTLPLDPARIALQFDRAARTYDAAAHLQQTVRGELLERLAALRIEPRVVLDLGAGTGHGALALSQRYRTAHCCAIDLAFGMLVEAGARRPAPPPRRWLARVTGGQQPQPHAFSRLCADAQRLPLAEHSVDLVFSNLMLQWAPDPDACLRELQRVLRPGGVLCFSTFGPGTLRELRAAWDAVDAAAGREYSHVSPFIDMHDLGSALTRAGFTESVLDVDAHQTLYANVRELMKELRAIGAGNATQSRPRTLHGRGTLRALEQAYERHREADGALPASWDVVYGLAYVRR
jgi:malonyl-CoA O-methyltransferase